MESKDINNQEEEKKEESKSQQENKPTSFHWPPLESDPEIFTKYMQEGGMPTKWCFSELFGLDDELLAFVPKPVLGVIINA